MYPFTTHFKTNQLDINYKLSIKQLRFFVIKSTKFNQNIILLIIQNLELITGSRQLTLKFYSNKLNIKPYNRLDKKVTDFKKPKDGPAMLCTTKCFHYQNEKDTDNNKKHKTHIQHQKWNKYYKKNHMFTS